jgi:S-formylglutathione hydrolase FrmB
MVTADVPIELTIDRVLPPRVFEANERVRELVVTSERLSRFHRRPVVMRAAVILPQSYASEPERHYPVLYQIPGFGGRHYGAAMAAQTPDPLAREGIAAIRVVLDPDCPLGHHVFADSANNGPWGAALTRELVPHLEKTYRAIARPEARLLTGHSSGGWSSLWLQITYPTFFGGVWSTSPDPVDFRDFQGIDLYRDRNFFRDDHGAERPLARRGERPVLFFQPFSEMERVLGHGGQLASFEAVFSPRMRDGQPRSLWNRDTGAIDSLTARTWEKYDIRLVLERHWRTLGPRLRGKLTVITGGLDTFYLEGAVIRLRESLHRLGSDAVVELVPGKDHGNLRDPELQARIAAQMAARLRGAGIGTTGSRGSLLLPTSR